MAKRNPAVTPVKTLPLKATLASGKGKGSGKAAPSFGGAFGAKKGN